MNPEDISLSDAQSGAVSDGDTVSLSVDQNTTTYFTGHWDHTDTDATACGDEE